MKHLRVTTLMLVLAVACGDNNAVVESAWSDGGTETGRDEADAFDGAAEDAEASDAPSCSVGFDDLVPIPDCGWTGENGSPHAIWGLTADNIYAVGRYGYASHYDGVRWSRLNLGTYEDLWGVWGTSPSNVFITGSRWLYRFDGESWRRQQVDGHGLGWIWGLSECDVFSTGQVGSLQHFDGSRWSEFPAPGEPRPSPEAWAFSDMWGTSTSDLYVLGNVLDYGAEGLIVHGRIAHYDGVDWTEVLEVKGSRLDSIWAASSASIYVAGGFDQSGLVLHYDGNSWNTVFEQSDAELTSIWGRSDSDVYAAGFGGTVVHYDGTSWDVVVRDLDAWVIENLFGTPERLWFAADSGLGYLDGDDLTFTYRWPLTTSINALTGCSKNEMYAVGMGSPSALSPVALRYDGSDWTWMDVPGSHALFGSWCVAPNDVYAVGEESTILHYDGETWAHVASPEPATWLRTVWASSPNDVFAAGQHGTALHYDGSAWTNLDTGTDAWIRALSGTGADDVYAATDDEILHFDGTAWSLSSTKGARSVWASDAMNAFAVTQGDLVRYDGTTWSNVHTAPYSSQQGFVEYAGIWGTSPSDVWAVGSSGAVTHFDGMKGDTTTDFPHAIYAVWASGPDDAVVAGAPMVLRYRCTQ